MRLRHIPGDRRDTIGFNYLFFMSYLFCTRAGRQFDGSTLDRGQQDFLL